MSIVIRTRKNLLKRLILNLQCNLQGKMMKVSKFSISSRSKNSLKLKPYSLLKRKKKILVKIRRESKSHKQSLAINPKNRPKLNLNPLKNLTLPNLHKANQVQDSSLNREETSSLTEDSIPQDKVLQTKFSNSKKMIKHSKLVKCKSLSPKIIKTLPH